MRLLWDADRLPRSTRRHDWRLMWRWRRVTLKQLAKDEAEKIEMFARFASGMTPDMRRKVMEHIANPPVLLGPMFYENKPGTTPERLGERI